MPDSLRPTWADEEADLEKPNVARIYDYYLGGFHNFEVDRQAAAQLDEIFPDTRLMAVVNRAFLRRAVNFMLDQAIDQFLDIGSGIPTVGNVHELVQKRNPSGHVVYVDIDPIAVKHSQRILQGNEHAAIVRADALEPELVLQHEHTQRLLDFQRPLGLLFVAFWHLFDDDAAVHRAARSFYDVLAPGSLVALSHTTSDGARPEFMEAFEAYRKSARVGKLRTHAEISELFHDLQMVEPGLVRAPQWRPERADHDLLDDPREFAYAGMARKI